MTKEEYKLAILAANSEYGDRLNKIMVAYALQNQKLKVGDTIRLGKKYLKVQQIKWSRPGELGGEYPDCVYECSRLTAKKEDRKKMVYERVYNAALEDGNYVVEK